MRLPLTRVHQLLAHAIARRPQAIAVVHHQEQWSYARLGAEAAGAAAQLRKSGITTGDRVLTVLPDSLRLVALIYACSLLGAVLVPVAPDATTFQLDIYAGDARPGVIVVAHRSAPVLSGPAGATVVTLAELFAGHHEASAARRLLQHGGNDKHRVAFLLYTSGSSARPRAVICPHDAVLFAVRAIAARLDYRDGDVVYSRIPLSFDYGLYQVLLSAHAMCTLVLGEGTAALGLLPEMREVGATVVPIVPSLGAVLGVLVARAKGIPPVRLFTNTAEELPLADRAALRAGFPGARLALMYGLTECKRATIMPPDGDLDRPQSVGVPVPGTALWVLADGELTRAPGVVGEIVVEGPHVMAGYWRASRLTREHFAAPAGGQRQLRTGDLGYLDEHGYLFLRGRVDDTFKRNGIRMSCREVEAAALDIPGIRAAAAVPPAGQADLALFAVSDLSPHEIGRQLAARLPPARRPATCHLVPGLPLTHRGKVDRAALRAAAADFAGFPGGIDPCNLAEPDFGGSLT